MKTLVLFASTVLIATAATAQVRVPRSFDDKTEVEAIHLMGLNQDQIIRFHKLKLTFDAKHQELYKLQGEQQFARGSEINVEWRAGLKKIFSADQWTIYSGYWSIEPTFAEAQKDVYGQLKVSAQQRKALEALDTNRTKLKNLAHSAWQAEDSEAVASKVLAMSKAYRTGLENTLTKPQLAKYDKLWSAQLRK